MNGSNFVLAAFGVLVSSVTTVAKHWREALLTLVVIVAFLAVMAFFVWFFPDVVNHL